MRFTKIFFIVVAAGFLIQSCKNKRVRQAMPPSEILQVDSTFRFSANEQKLFEASDVPVLLNLDTVNTITQVISFGETIPYEKSIAIAFTCQDGYSFPKIFHVLYRKGRSHSAVPNAKKTLRIEIDSARIITYSGGYVENDPDPEKMDSVVAVFMEAAFTIDADDDKTKVNYVQPGIRLEFHHDDCSAVTNFCTAAARGYILFQRKNSVAIFNKPIDSLNNQQLNQLATKAPFVVGVSERKTTQIK